MNISSKSSGSSSQDIKVKAAVAATEAMAATSARQQPSTRTLHSLLQLPERSMELCQIELIYRAEGNANLVLALPQFKKVLRLPKMQTNYYVVEAAHCMGVETTSKEQDKLEQPQEQQQQQQQQKQRNTSETAADAAVAIDEKVGALTMQDFMAYIEIIRRLLGNEFVCTADIVAIPKESDRLWINEHIRAARPIARLDKEFCGQFGLLLPDATLLPDTFNVLLSNLQATTIGDTYAIEIKPKQGWLLLPSDVNNLFDLMPTTETAVATSTTTAAATTAIASTSTKAVNVTTIQAIRETTTPAATTAAKTISTIQSATSATSISTSTPAKVAKTDCRCRYCSMQLLKLQMGKIKRISAYCPMDLFSGVHSRMLSALDALFNCPQNNLRIFQNGNLLYGDHAESISFKELCEHIFHGDIIALIKHLLVTCLLREYNDEDDDGADVISKKEDTKVVEEEEVEELKAFVSKNTRHQQHYAAVAASFAQNVVETGDTETEANVAASAIAKENVVVVVKAVDENVDDVGQPSHSSATLDETLQRTRATTITTPTTTSRKKATTTVKTAKAAAAATEESEKEIKKTETEAALRRATQAQINKAEILCLPKNCVLKKILHLQLLSKINFTTMWKRGYASKKAKSYNALRTLLAKSSEPISFDEMTPEEQYMLGATALDCSIMLTFQEIEMPTSSSKISNQTSLPWLVHLPHYEKFFLTKLTLLDLDPKPDSHFYKYIKQTKDIVKCSEQQRRLLS